MKKWEYVSTVLSQMLDKTQKPFVQREICDHIDDRIDYYKSAGYSADESEEKAVEHMGDPIQLGFRMNLLYDNRKYNRLSLICLVILGGNLACAALLKVMDYFVSFAISEIVSQMEFFLRSLCDNPIFIIIAIGYFLCSKTKNYNHLIIFGIMVMLYYFRKVPDMFYFQHYSGDYYILIEALNSVLRILTNDKIIILSNVIKIIYIAFGLLTGIMSLGFGLYVKSYVNGKSKTSLINRYENYKWVPFAVAISCNIALIVFEILMMNGVLLNA